MSTTRFGAEQEAFSGFAELLVRAERVRQQFADAQLTLPEPLKRLLGLTEEEAKHSKGLIIPPPPIRSRPPGTKEDWIYVSLENAVPMTVVPAVLQGRKNPLRVKDLVNKVTEFLPNVSGGTVANTLSRLKIAGLIDKAEGGGWILTNPAAAAVIHDGKLWGPVTAFQKTEVASHRRDAIAHVLSQFTSGLQVLQIVEQLRACDWLRAPLNKDLVKEDIAALASQEKIRRRGNTKKWELSPERGEP